MEDYHVLSMADLNSPVVDHGEVLHVKDVPWASSQMGARCSVQNGKYYLFFPARDHDGIFRIGVATSSSPQGPFQPEEQYIPGSFSIDPAVFIDEDNEAYMLFGGLWGGQLEKWQTEATWKMLKVLLGCACPWPTNCQAQRGYALYVYRSIGNCDPGSGRQAAYREQRRLQIFRRTMDAQV